MTMEQAAPAATIVAATAFHIAKEQASGTVVWLCDDDQQGEALADATAALGVGPVVFVPASDALPGDTAPASPGNVGRREAALRALRRGGQSHVACILSGEAAMRLYPCPEAMDDAPLTLALDGPFDPPDLAAELERLGYVADDRVDEPGEFAIRGEVIDLFPAQTDHPVRLDFAERRIVGMRAYDPATQRSLHDCEYLEIERAGEASLVGGVCILAHLRPGAWGVTGGAQARRERFLRLAGDVAARGGKPLDAVEEATWRRDLSDWTSASRDKAEPLPRFAAMRAPLAACRRFLRPLVDEGRKLILVGSARDLRFLRGRLEKRLLMPCHTVNDLAEAEALSPGTIAVLTIAVDHGFLAPDRVVLAAGDLLGSRASMETRAPSGLLPLQVPDLHIGDLVVHQEHGVGRIAALEGADGGGEMIVLDYAGDSRRLLPAREADNLWRYGADGEAVTLDRLDGSSWQKRRATVEEAVRHSAEALVTMARERASLTAPVFDPDPALYERFAAAFMFNETPDQARAIAAVREDLASGRPMDRLVIGDVGYGKTEVALRAAALAALAGYQAVVAAPTTVLARQHLDVFMRRFAGTDIKVAGLSRLSSAAEKKEVKAGLADGSIGVVIGTGAVMGASLRYARLGLVVIDEEQRFGAGDKARLRGDGCVHVLTLSATPIPRTLQGALVGLQAVSVIATSPARRQPIRTAVEGFDDGRIRAALMREASRGGQSFVVVPRIEDMAPLADRLRRLVPDLALVEAHGKMPAAEIDAAMVGFAQGTGDVLLATNIIEAGLDIPRANTMIVWRADRFGLAQLHQLRGRVGRGNRRGQVWLLSESTAARTLQRLRTLSTFDRLGAGFDISLRDLDMRGGGDLSGESQAGHMKLIGVDLYQHLLDKALRAVRGETVEDWTPDLHLETTGCLPADWIPEADVRLGLYGRLARLPYSAALDGFEEELLDRFGALPPPALLLIETARLVHLARAARIARVDAGPAAIALTPASGFAGDPAALGLREKQGRWLLAEALTQDARMERLGELLEALAA